MERKTSSSDTGIRQPLIRVVADRFRHFRPWESPRALKVQRTERPWRLRPAAHAGVKSHGSSASAASRAPEANAVTVIEVGLVVRARWAYFDSMGLTVSYCTHCR